MILRPFRLLMQATLVGVVLTGCSDNTPSRDIKRETAPIGAGFDFYVLALSWSPSYCEAAGDDANRQQCDQPRPYGFIVHGLWPQFEHGYPEFCPTERSLFVPQEELAGLYDLMPSAGLIRHQWQKHGTCSGLSRDEYFDTLREARERIEVPSAYRRIDAYRTVDPGQLEAAFLQSNEGLKAGGITVTCDKRYLREVRICLTRELAFRECPEIERGTCRLDKVVMPPARGG